MKNGFDLLDNADERTLERLSERRVLTAKEKERMLSMSMNKLNRMNDNTEDELQVSGVEPYNRPKWYGFATAAASLLLVGGIIGGGAYMIKNHIGIPAGVFANLGEKNTQKYKELRLHEPPYSAESYDEAYEIIDKYRIDVPWSDRHDYRIDSEYYAELLLTENYDINSLEAKSFIYHMMLNSYLYYDTAKGSLIGQFVDDETHYSTIDFQVDYNAQESYSRGSNNFNNDIFESFVYDSKSFSIYPDNTYTLEETIRDTQTINLVEDNYRHINVEGAENGVDHCPALEIMFAGGNARKALIPEGYAAARLNDFDNWEIDGTTEYLGRTAAEITGSYDNGSCFTMTVDIATGILLRYTDTESGENWEMTKIATDIPVERVEFTVGDLKKRNTFTNEEVMGELTRE